MAEMKVTKVSGADETLDEQAIGEFASRLRGELIRPGDEGYIEAGKVWNGMIVKKPSLVARAKSAADVICAVNFARDNEMPLAVRGGGHNVAGTGTVDGGLVIDLSPMKGVHVDPEHRTVRAEGGVTIGELDGRTQLFGLAAPMGVVSKTGIAGLTLNGGIGWMRRKHGLSSDNLASVDIVTADGGFLTASEDENADLFWGVRGGGGNFGVVTSFEYRLHPVGPEVMFCFVFYPGDRAKEVLRYMNEYMAHAPDEVSPLSFLGRIPPDAMFPEERHGEQFVAIAAMYAGGVEEGENALVPLRELGDAIADFSGVMPYAEAQKILDEDYPDGGRYYWKSVNANALGDEAMERLIAHAEAAPSGHSTIDVWYQGGAMGRVAASGTAFGERSSPILLGVEANWEEPEDDEANVEWTRNAIADMKRFSDGGMYLNFPGFGEEGEEMVRSAYGGNYERLAEIKKEYDPENLFRLNQNIKPSAR